MSHDTTAIEWTDSTWNPTTGCSHVSPGCMNCYAETLSLRWKRSLKPWTAQNAAENVKLHPDRLTQPLKWKEPRRIFVNSMSDLFHDLISFDFVDHVFTTMAKTPRHTYQILTKRPERMREYTKRWAAPLPNVWLGVSVEDQRRADERIPILLDTPAAIRFLSCEPLLGRVDLMDWLSSLGRTIDWVIVGGESGPKFRQMDVQWVRSLHAQCRDTNVAFFFKQHGGRTPKSGGRMLDGREYSEFPANALFRPSDGA